MLFKENRFRHTASSVEVGENRFPLNNINECWFLLLVQCAHTVLKLKIWVDKNHCSY